MRNSYTSCFCCVLFWFALSLPFIPSSTRGFCFFLDLYWGGGTSNNSGASGSVLGLSATLSKVLPLFAGFLVAVDLAGQVVEYLSCPDAPVFAFSEAVFC